MGWAETKVGAWTEAANAAWWKEHTTPEQWKEERTSIHKQLLAIDERIGTTKAVSNRNFTSWVNHLKWLSLYPENDSEHEFFSDPRSQRTYIALAQKPEVRDAFEMLGDAVRKPLLLVRHEGFSHKI